MRGEEPQRGKREEWRWWIQGEGMGVEGGTVSASMRWREPSSWPDAIVLPSGDQARAVTGDDSSNESSFAHERRWTLMTCRRNTRMAVSRKRMVGRSSLSGGKARPAKTGLVLEEEGDERFWGRGRSSPPRPEQRQGDPSSDTMPSAFGSARPRGTCRRHGRA